MIKKAPSFEDALRQAVELMKKRFARYSAVTAYVADGEDLAVHTALERPQGPDRVGRGGGPLAEAAQGQQPTVFSDLTASPAWARRRASPRAARWSRRSAPRPGLWAILEVWSDFRDAFTPQDVKLLGRWRRRSPRRPRRPDACVRPLRGASSPPLVTPFHADGGARPRRLSRPTSRRYAADDLAGYLVLGSNGEAASLDEDEKLAARRARRGARRRRRFLLVGTGLESTRATVAFTRKAADLGADAVLVLTPRYYKPQMTVEALRRHFEAVADASPVPVYLYSVPAFTGLPWPAGLAAALAAHPRIAGSRSRAATSACSARIIGLRAGGFEVACGYAPVLYPALCLGAVGRRAGRRQLRAAPDGRALPGLRGGRPRARAPAPARPLTPLAAAVTATHGVAGLKLGDGPRGAARRHACGPRCCPAPAEPARGDPRRCSTRPNAAAL